MTLNAGTRIIYPNQGICVVVGKESKEVAGQKLNFITLRREIDGAVVMVPESKVESVGLRQLASSSEVDSVFSFLKGDSDKANLDWKQRARTNVERMSQGGLLGLAEVVKGLQVLSELRPLPTKEHELYDNARRLLVTEISAALSMSECDAEDTIDVALFPPGKARPKRTVEEFRKTLGDEDGLGAVDDFTDLDLASIPLEAEAAEVEMQVEVKVDLKPEPAGESPKKRGRPAKLAAAVKAKRGRPVKSAKDKS